MQTHVSILVLNVMRILSLSIIAFTRYGHIYTLCELHTISMLWLNGTQYENNLFYHIYTHIQIRLALGHRKAHAVGHWDPKVPTERREFNTAGGSGGKKKR